MHFLVLKLVTPIQVIGFQSLEKCANKKKLIGRALFRKKILRGGHKLILSKVHKRQWRGSYHASEEPQMFQWGKCPPPPP